MFCLFKSSIFAFILQNVFISDAPAV